MYPIYIFDPEAKQLKQSIQQHFHHAKQVYTNPDLETLNEMNQFAIYVIDIHSDAFSIIKHMSLPATIIIGEQPYDAMNAYQIEHCFFVFRHLIPSYLVLGIQKAIHCLDQTKHHLLIQRKDRNVMLALSKITLLERNGRMTYIHTIQHSFKTYQKLSWLMPFLDSSFVQCHQSFVVNTHYIQEFTRTQLVLQDGTIVPISRTYAKNTMSLIYSFSQQNVSYSH